jgi:hypothetical protein
MEFKGRIMKVFPVVSGTGRNGEWRRQEFIFEYFEHETDRWTDKVLLSALNGRIDEYDLHEGDECLIGFSHNVTNEIKGRQYNEMRIYKLEKIKSFSTAPSQENMTETKENLPPTPSQGGGEEKEQVKEGDLPF